VGTAAFSHSGPVRSETSAVNYDDFVLDNGLSPAVPALGRFGLLAMMISWPALRSWRYVSADSTEA